MYIMVSSSDLTVTLVNPLFNGAENLQYVTYLSLVVKAREMKMARELALQESIEIH